VLEQLAVLVPYEHCAVLEAVPGHEPRFLSAPQTAEAEQAALEAEMRVLLKGLVEGQPALSPASPGRRLVVPLLALDQIGGVLLVERADAYDEQHVQALVVVAAQLAAYFSMRHASTREQQRVVELAEARLAAETADRAKDEFL